MHTKIRQQSGSSESDGDANVNNQKNSQIVQKFADIFQSKDSIYKCCILASPKNIPSWIGVDFFEICNNFGKVRGTKSASGVPVKVS